MHLIPRHRPEGTLPEEMSRLFEDFFSTGRSLMKDFWGNGHDRASMFPVDVRETEDKVIVDAELPGVDPKDVQIKVEGTVLVITAERKHEKEEKAKDFHRVERSYGRFQRQIELPWGTDPEKVEATYKNGVLTVEIAKREEAKPKTIQVKIKE
jgi:HSP20 family protein